MRVLREIGIILGSLALSIVAGYFLYAFFEDIRLDLYCKAFREGLDCYQEGWVKFPTSIFSLVGSFVAVLSITLVSCFCSETRARSLKITLILGSVLALPVTSLSGPIAFTLTVLAGLVALLLAMR